MIENEFIQIKKLQEKIDRRDSKYETNKYVYDLYK